MSVVITFMRSKLRHQYVSTCQHKHIKYSLYISRLFFPVIGYLYFLHIFACRWSYILILHGFSLWYLYKNHMKILLAFKRYLFTSTYKNLFDIETHTVIHINVLFALEYIYLSIIIDNPRRTIYAVTISVKNIYCECFLCSNKYKHILINRKFKLRRVISFCRVGGHAWLWTFKYSKSHS